MDDKFKDFIDKASKSTSILNDALDRLVINLNSRTKETENTKAVIKKIEEDISQISDLIVTINNEEEEEFIPDEDRQEVLDDLAIKLRKTFERKIDRISALKRLEESSVKSSVTSLGRSVSSSFSDKNLASKRSHIRQQVGFTGAVHGITSQMSSSDIRKQQDEIRKQIQDQSNVAQKIMSDKTQDPYQMRQQLEGVDKIVSELNVKEAVLQSAQDYKRKYKEDEAGLQHRGKQSLDKINARRFKEETLQQVSTGGISAEKANEARVTAENRLIEVMQKVTEAIESQTGVSKELTDQYKKAEEDVKKTAIISDAANRYENNVQKRTGTWAKALGIVGMASKAAGDLMISTTVDTPIANLRNKAAMMNIANAEYDDQMAAQEGNVAAMVRRIQGARGAGNKFGADMASRTFKGQALKATGFGDDMASSGILIATGIGEVQEGIQELLGSDQNRTAIGSFINSSSALANITVDMLSKITSTRKGLEGQQAFMDAFNSMNYQDTTNMQYYRDDIQAMGTGTRGMGSERERIVSQVLSKEFIKEMGSIGMGSDRVNSVLSTVQSEGMAKSFDPTTGMKTLRLMETLGLGTAEQNAARAGAFQSAGADNAFKAMAGTLELAVSKGMDSSKAVDILVSGITDMAKNSSSAAMGIDSTEAISRLIMQLSNPNIQNENMRAESAIRTANARGDLISDTTISYSEMLRQQEVAQTLGSSEAASIMNSLGKEDRATAAGMFGNKKAQTAAAKLLAGKGLAGEYGIIGNAESGYKFSNLKSAKDKFYAIEESNRRKLTGDTAYSIGLTKEEISKAEEALKKGDITDKYAQKYIKANVLHTGNKNIDSPSLLRNGAHAESDSMSLTGKSLKDMDVGENTGKSENIATKGDTEKRKREESGMTAAEKLGGGKDNALTVFSKIADILSNIEVGSFKDAGQQMVSNMDLAVADFGTGVDKFARAAEHLETFMSVDLKALFDNNNEVSKTIDKLKSFVKSSQPPYKGDKAVLVNARLKTW